MSDMASGVWYNCRRDAGDTEVWAVATLNEEYVVDENGERVSVLLDWADYRRLLEELEELEAIRAYDAAKASGDEAIPFEQAMDEIENTRG
jgi:hypothetical protein